MGTGTDAYYQPSNYREPGGNRTVIGGELDVVSGGQLNVESGGYITEPVQTLGTSQVGTDVIVNGLTTLTASTTGPVYTLAAPIAGVTKHIAVTSNTSSGTANLNTNSTGVSVSSSGDNQLQFDSIGDRVTLVAASTTAWIIMSNVGSVATATQST